MDSFLKKNLPLVNKNKIININYGKLVSNNIFDTKINDLNLITHFIEKIKTLGFRHKLYNFKVKEFNYMDKCILKINNKLHNFGYSVNKSISDKQFNINILDLKNDNLIIQCPNEYNSIIEYDQQTISINSLFDINIKNYKLYYTLNIDIKKPCDYSIINQFLSILINKN
jgi:hypothetical protein